MSSLDSGPYGTVPVLLLWGGLNVCFSQPHWEGLSRCCLLTGPTVAAQRLHKLLPDGFFLMPDLRNLPFRGTFLDSQCLRRAVRYT